MHLSTRRSISRAAAFGLLATTPLIAGWGVAGGDDTRRAPSGSAEPAVTEPAVTEPAVTEPAVTDGDELALAASGVPDRTWLDTAPAVPTTLGAVGLAPTDDLADIAPDAPDAPDDLADIAPDAPDAPDAFGTPGLTADDIAAIDTSEVTVTVLREEARAEDEPAAYLTTDGETITAARVRTFLDGRNAPMAAQAEAIVAAGIAHDVDPRVVVGIAIAESNAGERLPVGSHNAWGWGGSGKFGLAHWDSWEESLDAYTARLGALYDTDDVDRSFAETYCPPNWRWWLDTVTWAIDEI